MEVLMKIGRLKRGMALWLAFKETCSFNTFFAEKKQLE